MANIIITKNEKLLIIKMKNEFEKRKLKIIFDDKYFKKIKKSSKIATTKRKVIAKKRKIM